jgi:hypothetical protein
MRIEAGNLPALEIGGAGLNFTCRTFSRLPGQAFAIDDRGSTSVNGILAFAGNYPFMDGNGNDELGRLFVPPAAVRFTFTASVDYS